MPKYEEVNNHPHSGWLEHALKGRASGATLVPMVLLFMDPSPKAKVVMKTMLSTYFTLQE